jgi:hypothetical protein
LSFWVILDNPGSHKAPAIRNAIRPVGARRLFLPADSSDLNPIEQVFAKLKHLLRKAAARNTDSVWRRIGALGRIAANVMRIGCDPRQVRPGMLRVAPDRANPIKRNTLYLIRSHRKTAKTTSRTQDMVPHKPIPI